MSAAAPYKEEIILQEIIAWGIAGKNWSTCYYIIIIIWTLHYDMIVQESYRGLEVSVN